MGIHTLRTTCMDDSERDLRALEPCAPAALVWASPFSLLWWLGALLLIQAPLAAQSLPDFAPYARKAELLHFLSGHTNVTSKTNLLLMTAFLSYDAALQYVVSLDGNEVDYAERPMRGYTAGHSKQISGSDLKLLSEVIRRFPEYDRSPPIGNLLVVSFLRGTNWVTHSYNWDSPPTPVKQAFEIIGERFETKHQAIK
jgi:hypothetical protein